MDVKRTEVAERAVGLAEIFNVSIAVVRVQGTCEFIPELKMPEGPSTAGGRLARQHITLNPAVASESAVTVGWLDVARRQSLLRTCERLQQIHEERGTGQPFPLDVLSYHAFFNQMHRFLEKMELSPFVEQPTPGSALAPPAISPQASGRKPMLAILLILGVCLLLVVGAAVLWFTVRGSSPP